MGWRSGQGIGPRLNRKQKARMIEANHRMYGCKLPKGFSREEEEKEAEEEEDIDPKYRGFLFAPDDVPEFLSKPKDNLFGIGYKGLDRPSFATHINLFEPPQPTLSLTTKSGQKKIKFSGQAFGVGAYEEEDDDIYARDDMSRYDFELGPAGAGGRGKGPRDRRSRWDEAAVEEAAKCIEGFHIATTKSNVKKSFPAPSLPRHFTPKPGGRRSRFDVPKDEVLKTTNPTPSQRQQALSLPKDVPTEPKPAPTQSDEQLKKLLATNIPTAAAQLSSFQPFARNPDKQKRYDQYLVCLKNKRGDALPLLQPKTMTEWEREREKVEFERAAVLYRPMTGSMNSKFVSAGSSQDADEAKVAVPMEGEGATDVKDAKKAAQMKMYGRLTREKVDWHPAKMLCIRFNVKHPYGDYSVVGVPKVDRSKFELFNFINNPTEAQKSVETEADTMEPVPMASTDVPSANQEKVPTEHGEEPRETETLEEEQEARKPPLDLFKSIFLDSSGSSSEEEEEDGEKQKAAESAKPARDNRPQTEKEKLFGTELVKEEPNNEKPKPWEEKRQNILRNKAPAKGIFANIDFEALNKKKLRPPEQEAEEEEEDDEDGHKEKPKEEIRKPMERPKAADFFKDDSDEETEAFGPAKPPPMVPSSKKPSADSSSSEEEDADGWKEKKRSSERKRKKHSKKRSSHKKKKGKKRKRKSKSKKRRRKHSSSSSEESSEDSDSSSD